MSIPSLGSHSPWAVLGKTTTSAVLQVPGSLTLPKLTHPSNSCIYRSICSCI